MQKDNINPQHYKNGKVECIDALESATIGKKGVEAVCTANVIKYLWRYEDKNGLEDIMKAQWYLEKLIEHIKSKDEKGSSTTDSATFEGRVDEKGQ